MLAIASALAALPCFGTSETTGPEGSTEVMVVPIEGVINPVASEFLEKSLLKANDSKIEAVVVALDTPGGLDTSMRSMVKAILASGVPVVVYVSPSGARAASAGVFITLAAHVAAMAPQTNIGAAHPVGVGGKIDDTMAEKVTNDAVAYIKSIAEKRGRNAKWAEEAVRKSVSATETEALEKHIIDLVSDNLETLLGDIDGREVETTSGKKTLRTKDSAVTHEEMTLRLRILNVISDPNVAYMLMMLGFYGLFFELTNPGTVFPGVTGAICLILAFYAFQTLPVNYAGLLLIIVGIILFILEIKVVSYGALTIGGIISMVLGSIMLFEKGGPLLKVSISFILVVVIITAGLFVLVLGLAVKAYRRKPVTGTEGLRGEHGFVKAAVGNKGGTVLVHGELWNAYSDEPIAEGEEVTVSAVEGLRIKVTKKIG